ncbi:hypothetical protein [Leuconostoc pseudomesenteroides]|uniref:hypothetical protein n=1 Tax=Leuconostoc pseudomesenteroides TaxID=33968 RepID=UPI00345E3678
MVTDIYVMTKYWYFVVLVVLWIVFISVIISKKYLNSSKISFFKIYIAPIVLLLFGIDKVVHFSHFLLAILLFLLTTILFSFIGARLSYDFQNFIYSNDQIKFTGGKYAIVLMLANVIVMLLLNFHSLVNPMTYNSWQYLIIYSLLGGAVKGLLVGQSINMWWHITFLKLKKDRH